ncbi:MAG: PEGA domain-containing protein [Candidatus Dojkabacteria bacterium]|jgi:hypothetical protein
MKNSKKVILIILGILILSVLLYFLPINKIIGRLPLINRFYNNTSLEILVKKGKAKVWINGTDYGETPTSLENLPEGKYLIELEKIVDNGAFYKKQSFNIDLVRNTSARIDLEIGPEDILHGIILYYTPISTSSKEGFLAVSSNIEGAKVFVDQEFIKASPVTNMALRESQYDVKVIVQGHEDVEVPVLIRNNYVLNLKTYHFPIPIIFDTLDTENE